MKVFLGGATGATGQEMVRYGRDRADLVVHVRPQSVAKYQQQQPDGPAPEVFDLGDLQALRAAMAGCDVVISAIGTMRKRFSTGDTYDSSDIATTEQLIAAAQATGVGHFVLMGAYGAAWVPGPYYDAKRKAEQLVMDSGIPWTILRPSALIGNGRGPAVMARTGLLEAIPGVGGAVRDAKGIPVSVCGKAMVDVALAGSHKGTVLKGRDIWAFA